jgi:hypothetical protein
MKQGYAWSNNLTPLISHDLACRPSHCVDLRSGNCSGHCCSLKDCPYKDVVLRASPFSLNAMLLLFPLVSAEAISTRCLLYPLLPSVLHANPAQGLLAGEPVTVILFSLTVIFFLVLIVSVQQ